MPNDDYDNPSKFVVPALTVSGAAPVVPLVVDTTVTTLLAVGASADVDVNVQSLPLLDVYLFADQQVDVLLFERIDAADTFRQVGAAIVVPAGGASEVIVGRRIPASQVRVRFTNTGAAPLTVLAAEVLARSL